jgi:heme o synthase
MTVRPQVVPADASSLAGRRAGGGAVALAKGRHTAVTPALVLPSRFSDYACLTKPEVTFLVLIATGLGSFMAAESLGLGILFHTVLGTALLASGTATLNHYLERAYDGLMRRTANRPLPSGRLTPRQVLIFGAALSVLGGVYLAFFVNPLTSLIGAATLLSYLFVYTPLKRKTTWATFIGAFPGAAPVLIGWAAVRNALDIEAWVLYAILFLWQFPHFLAIAWIYREDYARAGMQMLPKHDPQGDLAFKQILGYSLALVPVSVLPFFLGMAGHLYFCFTLALGLAFFYFVYQTCLQRSKLKAKVLLHVTVIYLPIVYAMMVIDKM